MALSPRLLRRTARWRPPAAKPVLPDQGFKAEVIDSMLPDSPMGWAFEVGPDLLGAAVAANYGYQQLGGAGGALAAGGEDLALGVLGSGVGRFAGGALAHMAAKATGASPRQMREMIMQGRNMGGMVGGLGAAYFGPRPFTDAIREENQAYLDEEALREHWILNAAATNPIAQNYDMLLNGGLG